MKSRGSQERSSGTQARGGGSRVVWAVVVWARVVIGLILGTAGGVAFGHAWTSESAPWWWVGAISLLTGVLLLLSGLYARSRPPGASPEFVAREQAPAAQEPLVPLLGALLVYKYQRITHATLDKALEHQRTETQRRRLGEILISMGAVTRSDVEEALEYQRALARLKQQHEEQHQPAT